MEIEVKALNIVLAVNSRNLSDKHTIPYFQNIMFDVKDGKCTVVTGDQITEIATHLQVSNAEDAKFCIEGTSFIETMKLIDDEIITITVKDTTAIIQAGKNKYRLGCMDAKLFPRLLTDNEEYVGLPLNTVKHIESAAPFIKHNDTRTSLTGVNMGYSKGHLHIQGTDSFIFYNGKIEIDDEVESCIINRKIVDIIGCFKDSIVIDYAVNNKCAIFKDPAVTVKVRLVEGKYPDAAVYFDAPKANSILVNKQQFTKAVKRSNIYTSKAERKLVFEMDTETEQVKMGAEDKPYNKKFYELFDAEKMESEEDMFALNPLFLQTVLNCVESDNVLIRKNSGEREAVFFRDEEGTSGMECFVAPTTINS